MESAQTWAFYYLQAEDGEDRSHPNAFRIPKTNGDITLADVHANFPLGDPVGLFHFRFRMNSQKGDTFYWMDITSPTQVVPLVNGRVIAKVLRLQRPAKPNGLILHRKPVLKWIDTISSKSSVQPLNTRAPVERPQKYTDTVERPQKYTDNHPPKQPPATSSPKPEQSTVKRNESNESFEDFLSSGSAPPSKPKNEDVDLMGGDSSSWKPKAPTSGSSSAGDFNPLQAPASTPAPRPKTPPKPVVSAPAKNFNDDCGQTVGPVTLAEMEQHKVSSDGSQVYNPDLVDKSTKSSAVRAAMEERERLKAAEIERARQELLRRDQEKAAMDNAKAQSVVVLGPKLKLWAEDNGRKKNIRTLLSTMHQVMWPDSKWTEVNMAKLLMPNDVKKVYRRAIMVVHPDKAGGRTADQLVVAERIFDALNTAWDEFARTELK